MAAPTLLSHSGLTRRSAAVTQRMLFSRSVFWSAGLQLRAPAVKRYELAPDRNPALDLQVQHRFKERHGFCMLSQFDETLAQVDLVGLGWRLRDAMA